MSAGAPGAFRRRPPAPADEVLALVADGARRRLGATGAVLALVGGARLAVAARSGVGPALGAAAGPGACLERRVAEAGRPLRVADLAQAGEPAHFRRPGPAPRRRPRPVARAVVGPPGDVCRRAGRFADAQLLPPVDGDPGELEQVVTNLLRDAFQALHAVEGRRTVTVTTALDEAGERVRVTVSDDGPGIPGRDLDRVFEPFFTTRSDGTGLGLAICRRIVEGHGGRITIASGRDDGTHAVVELPVAQERESEPVTSRGEGPPGTHGIRVLVVDDEALVADLVSEILRLDGHQVDHATNGLEALARIRAERYGLVVSDVHMPDLDGPTFYRQLLDIDPAYADRVVFITGDVLSADTQRFLRTSGAPYLEKPFGITTFQAVVRRVLRAT